MDLRFVIANALLMNDGEVLVIPCEDFKEAESVRVRLFRLRKFFEPARRIIIKKRFSESLGYTVVLEREGPQLMLPPVESLKELLPTGGEIDLQRFIQLAVEDGLSLDEINNLLDGKADSADVTRLFQESLIFKQQAEKEED